MKKKQDLAVLQTNGSGVLSFAGVSASAGQVIKVLSATDSTSRQTTSTSYVTASNTLSVTITPSSASNKILLIFSSAGQSNGEIAYYTIYRDASNLSAGATGFTMTYDANDGYNSLAMTYLDSPATTSATTYQVYFKGTGGVTAVLNRSNVTGSLTCMEIKG